MDCHAFTSYERGADAATDYYGFPMKTALIMDGFPLFWSHARHTSGQCGVGTLTSWMTLSYSPTPSLKQRNDPV